MNTLLHKISLGAVSLALAVSSLFGYHAPAPEDSSPILGANQINFVGGKVYNLSGAGVAASDTSIPLVSFTQPVTNTALTMTDFGSILYGTIEANNSTKKEFVSCTGVTQNANGTAILTSCTRGLRFVSPYTSSSTLQLSHAGGSTFVLSNPPQLYNELAAKGNNETITGSWSFPSPTASASPITLGYANNTYATLATTTLQTFTGSLIFSASTTFTGVPTVPTPTASTSAANKGYVDGVAIAGAPNASYAAKGIVQQATTTNINARTLNGSTGAPLFLGSANIDDVASSSIQVYFASSSGATLIIPSISVDANDIVNIFSTAYNSNLNGGTVSDIITVFDGTATTTLSTATEGGSSGVGGLASPIGYYLAAGTKTLIVTGTMSNSSESRLLVQVFKR